MTQTERNAMQEFDKIKLKMDAIWKARDNEAGAVKDRALLVWGFLMFCYGGYAYLAAKVLLNCGIDQLCSSHLDAINMALLILSLITLRLSLNWVRMMKGAVAWAQNFDYLAEAFQHQFLRTRKQDSPCFQPKGFSDGAKATIEGVKRNKNCNECQGDPSYACIFSVANPTLGFYPDIDESSLTTNGGAYSPAKVTIAIARMSLIISLLLCLVHLIVACFGVDSCRSFVINHKGWVKGCVITLTCLFAGSPFVHLKSGFRAIKPLLNVLYMNDTISVGLRDIKDIGKIYASKDGGAK